MSKLTVGGLRGLLSAADDDYVITGFNINSVSFHHGDQKNVHFSLTSTDAVTDYNTMLLDSEFDDLRQSILRP